MNNDPLGLSGQVLDGQFRVDQFVGEGGFSVVYRGHNLGLDEPIALKFLKLPSGLSPEIVESFLRRFRDESRIQYKLSQGNLHIARSMAAGTALAPKINAVVPFAVLEWLEGRTLAAELEVRRGRGYTGIPLDAAILLLDSAAEALAYAHTQGVAHRDLNPGNLFFVETHQGRKLKVIDFGVAKLMTDHSLAFGPRAQTLGTIKLFAPAYGTPEQFDDNLGATGPWTDVYAFATLTLEILRDRPVLEETSLAAFAVRICDPSRRPTPRNLGLFAPDEVEAVFAKALALRPADRFAEIGLFWGALKAAVRSAKEKGLEHAALAAASLALPRVPRPESRTPPAPLQVSDPQEITRARAQGGASALAAIPNIFAPDLAAHTVPDLSPFVPPRDPAIVLPPHLAAFVSVPVSDRTLLDPSPPSHAPSPPLEPVELWHVHAPPAPHVPADADLPKILLKASEPPPAPLSFGPAVREQTAPRDARTEPPSAAKTLLFGSGPAGDPRLLDRFAAHRDPPDPFAEARARLQETVQAPVRAAAPKPEGPVPADRPSRPDGRPVKASEVMLLGGGASLSQFLPKEARDAAAARIAEGDGSGAERVSSMHRAIEAHHEQGRPLGVGIRETHRLRPVVPDLTPEPAPMNATTKIVTVLAAFTVVLLVALFFVFRFTRH